MKKMTPLKIIIVFLLSGQLWVILTDLLVAKIATSPEMFTRLSIMKGGAYFLVAGLLLYGLISRYASERDRAEKALQESELRFRSFVENANDVLFALTPAGVFSYVSPQWKEAFGYELSETIGRPFAPFLHPDDVPACLAFLHQVVATGKKQSGVEYRVRHKDGPYLWYTANASLIKDPATGTQTLIGIGRDITVHKKAEEALRETEERYRALFTRAGDGIFILATDGSLAEVNDSLARMHGYSVQEMQKLNLNDLDTPETAHLAPARMEKVLAGEALIFEVEHFRKDGTIFPLEVSASLITSGGTTYIQCFHRDITDRKKSEEQLVRSLKEKEVLLKEIHHRVKNNLSVIHSLLNLQAKSIADASLRAVFEDAKHRVNTMALIHRKLYQSTDLAHINFNEYLRGLVEGVADTYKRRDVDVVVDKALVALDVTVGIPCGLIVNELVSNCFKYAFPDGRKGTITVGINKDGAGNNVLRVADNGVGFPETTDFRNTASLGLQLVNVLAGQIHGKIELSRVEGTAFKITFPGTAEIKQNE